MPDCDLCLSMACTGRRSYSKSRPAVATLEEDLQRLLLAALEASEDASQVQPLRKILGILCDVIFIEFLASSLKPLVGGICPVARRVESKEDCALPFAGGPADDCEPLAADGSARGRLATVCLPETVERSGGKHSGRRRRHASGLCKGGAANTLKCWTSIFNGVCFRGCEDCPNQI